MALDDLVQKGAKASTGMVLTYSDRKIMIPVPQEFMACILASVKIWLQNKNK